VYLEQVVPRHSKKGDNTTITPALTTRGSGMTSISGQKRGQKWGAGNLFSDIVGLEPTGDNEQASLRTKKGKPSLKSDKQATSHNLEMPCCPVKMVKIVKPQGIRRTGMFIHNI